MGRILDRDFWDYVLAVNHVKEPATPDPKRHKDISVIVLKDEVLFYKTDEITRVILLMTDESGPEDYPYALDP